MGQVVSLDLALDSPSVGCSASELGAVVGAMSESIPSQLMLAYVVRRPHSSKAVRTQQRSQRLQRCDITRSTLSPPYHANGVVAMAGGASTARAKSSKRLLWLS